MGTCTEFGEFALLIKADCLALVGMLLDKLNLIGLVLTLHKRDCFINGKLEFLNLKVFLDDFLHFALDFFQILG